MGEIFFSAQGSFKNSGDVFFQLINKENKKKWIEKSITCQIKWKIRHYWNFLETKYHAMEIEIMSMKTWKEFVHLHEIITLTLKVAIRVLTFFSFFLRNQIRSGGGPNYSKRILHSFIQVRLEPKITSCIRSASPK